MKKLSILLALVLSLNIFATASIVNAETTVAELARYDFEEFEAGTATTLPAGITSEYDPGLAYEQVGADRGMSLKMGKLNGPKITFGEATGNVITASFELYEPASNAGTNNLLAHIDTLSNSWTSVSNNCLFYYGQKGIAFDWGTVNNTKLETGWIQVDLVFTNDTATSKSSLKAYLDGKLMWERTELPLASNLTLYNQNGTNNYFVDNIVIRDGEYISPLARYEKSWNFNDGTNRNKDNALGVPAASNPGEGWTLAPADGWYSFYNQVDAEHGLSWGSTNNQGFYYTLPTVLRTTAEMSFEFYTNDVTDGGQFYMKTGPAADNNYWTPDAFGIINGSTLHIGPAQRTIEANKWYKVDVQFIGGTRCKVYLNGELMVSGDGNTSKDLVAAPDRLYFTSRNRAGRITYIDNLKFKTHHIVDTFAATSDATVIPELQGNKLYVNFEKTVDPLTWDEFGVTVTADGQNVPVEIASLNDGKTKATIELENDLDFSKQYTITIPNTVKSIYGDTLSATTFNVTTTAEFEVYEDFSDETMASSNINKENTTIANGYASLGTSWGQFRYNFPGGAKKGKVKLSLDHRFNQTSTDNTSIKIAGTHTFSGNAFMYWMGGNPQLDWNNITFDANNTWTWQNNTWHHYDYIFDLDNKTVELYFDGVKGTAPTGEYATVLETIYFVNSGSASTTWYDNLHVSYYDGIAEWKYDEIPATVSTNTESIDISFKDAVDVDTLATAGVFNSAGFPAGEITATSNHTATITFDDTLVDGETYTINLGDVKSTTGDSYANSTVTFTAGDRFEISDIAVMDGETEVTLNSWDAQKAYTISADVVNDSGASKSVYAVLAGYAGTELKNVQVVLLSGETSGKWTANLAAASMADVTSLKIIAFEDLNSLAPMLDNPISL